MGVKENDEIVPHSSSFSGNCVYQCYSPGKLYLYCKTVIFKRPTSRKGNAMENESSQRASGGGWGGQPEPVQTVGRGTLTQTELPGMKKGGLPNRAGVGTGTAKLLWRGHHPLSCGLWVKRPRLGLGVLESQVTYTQTQG